MDFQKATAERILHIYKDLGHKRVLVADEVGLGKTFVAKQVIDLIREWNRSESPSKPFKVVYICSNANIAEQNIEKLGLKKAQSISESRLSMQHLYISISNKADAKALAEGKMPEAIIPLTPATSFRFFSTTGTSKERALIFDILAHLPELKGYEDQLSNFFRYKVKHWRDFVDLYNDKIKECGTEYIADMVDRLHDKLDPKVIKQLIDAVSGKPKEVSNAKIINDLRRVFAEISLDMLNPDLVIMDEFQRFSNLLKGDEADTKDEQVLLTRKFFGPEGNNNKILLLSATPYKPYSTLEEINADGRDEHYDDFIDVMKFLFVSDADTDTFKSIWQKYSACLKSTNVADLDPLLDAKANAENLLYGAMCRTERFNTGIINDSEVKEMTITGDDILSYAQSQRLIDSLSAYFPKDANANMPIEYVKSSPYLLSFMDSYVIKTNIVSALAKTQTGIQGNANLLLLSKFAINNYREIAPANAKLKYLHDSVFGTRSEKKPHLMLWVPASHPYYKAGGLFESKEAKDFSKILIFSQWEMVPRMISIMMSYYSEKYTFGQLGNVKYFSQKSNRYGENRLRSDSLLEYPCAALAALYNPAEYYGQRLSVIRKDVGAKIERLINGNEQTRSLRRKGRNNVQLLLILMKMLDGKSAEVETADLYIPTKALDVLTDVAIASPAVCAFRQSHDPEDARKVGKAFASIFNKPESAAIIDIMYQNRGNDDDYYESVLDYCAIGNLQAVLDEYAHMLGKCAIGDNVEGAVIETSRLTIDTADSIGNNHRKTNMRCHFAIPFIDKAITDKGVQRIKNIRLAFNSPFRPFILSTTSVGQEGLDFHWYSRKIVHWNLPSNAVDLEQREGRINRYKCHAIRKNVVSLFATETYSSWDQLFDKARAELKADYSDMVPYWCLPIDRLTDEQRTKLLYIERIIPLYPFSRDVERYRHLIDVLSLYRMTLGQPRQEELLKLLKGMNLSDDQLKQLTINLCPFVKESHRQ